MVKKTTKIEREREKINSYMGETERIKTEKLVG